MMEVKCPITLNEKHSMSQKESGQDCAYGHVSLQTSNETMNLMEQCNECHVSLNLLLRVHVLE